MTQYISNEITDFELVAFAVNSSQRPKAGSHFLDKKKGDSAFRLASVTWPLVF